MHEDVCNDQEEEDGFGEMKEEVVSVFVFVCGGMLGDEMFGGCVMGRIGSRGSSSGEEYEGQKEEEVNPYGKRNEDGIVKTESRKG